MQPLTYGRYGSQYDYVIHVALIATSRVLLITSFQPPLSSAHLLEHLSYCPYDIHSLGPRPKTNPSVYRFQYRMWEKKG